MGPADPAAIKQAIDMLGYALMGLGGIFTAWQRMRSAMPKHAETPLAAAAGVGLPAPEACPACGGNAEAQTPRIESLERAVSTLMDQGQTILSLLSQQRGVLDKILTKMSGL